MITEKKIEQAAEKYAFDKCSEKDIDLYDLNTLLSNAFCSGIDWYLDSLWHDAFDNPQKGTTCLLHVTYHFEDDPEEDYSEYVTSTWLGTGWSEDHFSSEADVTVHRWLNIKDLILP